MELNDEQKLALRAAARERKRKQRARDQQKRIRAIEAQQASLERVERRARHLHFFGECAPGRNATTFEDELQIHREFLRGLGQPDVRPAETLREVARRTYQAWIIGPFTSHDGRTIYVPGFNRAAQRFDGEYGFVMSDAPFDEIWSAPSGCSENAIINMETLPELPRVPKAPVKEEVMPEPIPTPPTPTPVIPRPQPDAIHFMYSPPDAHRYLQDGRL
jgi:hypothetical protein